MLVIIYKICGIFVTVDISLVDRNHAWSKSAGGNTAVSEMRIKIMANKEQTFYVIYLNYILFRNVKFHVF